MKHLQVISSNVQSIGYDPATKELEVTFKNGATYVYEDVPAGVHTALLLAPSVGSHLHQHVKPTYAVRRAGLISPE